MLNLAQLEDLLAGSPCSGQLHYVAETGSTSTDAMVAARTGAAHGAVFLADAQTAGRGRGDHRWQSAAGEGLYVSVILRPAAPPLLWTLLPFAAALAVIKAVELTTGVQVDLRWPNDLLVGGCKVCGILVESGKDHAGQPFAVAGIGINVHQRQFNPDLATPATSLDLVTNGWVAREPLLACLLKSLGQECLQLEEPTLVQPLLERVQMHSSWICGRRVLVHGPQACVGVTAGLDAHGFLLVETATGQVTVQTGGLRAAELE